jgi:hypothetical protein
MRQGIKKRADFQARGSQVTRGSQVCVSCFHESTLVHTHRCQNCDREVCTLCVVTVAATGEYLCLECATDCPVERAETVPPTPRLKRRGRRQ